MTISTHPKHPWLGLVVLIIVCFAAAGVGGIITASKIDNWYAALAKPIWTPPNWVFGPVWSVLYLSMAIAAWLIWRPSGFSDAAWPLASFGMQLFLNML